MRSSIICAASTLLVLIACATGQDPNDATGDLGGDTDSGTGNGVPPDTSNSNPYGAPADGGGAQKSHDGGTAQTSDSGTKQSDSGTTTTPDSGTTTMMTGGANDCTGTMSAQFVYQSGSKKGKPAPYDYVCDYVWLNTSLTDPGYPCTPGGNDCATLNGSGGYNPFCCYTPPSGSNCDIDYGNSQCVPK